MSTAIKWTEAHRPVAYIRSLEIATELVHASGIGVRAPGLILAAHASPLFESAWRAELAAAGLDAARINREVALVHALATASPETRAMIEAARADAARIIGKLATGRYVRETWWELRAGNIRGRRHINFGKHTDRAKAFALASEWGLDLKRGWRMVRVTQTRRAK